MTEKRRFKRVMANGYFFVFDKISDQLLGQLKDMTIKGMKLVSDVPVEVARKFQCRMALPEILLESNQIYFDAECRWCQKNESTGLYQIGFELSNVCEKDSDIIKLLLVQWESGQTDNQEITPIVKKESEKPVE